MAVVDVFFVCEESNDSEERLLISTDGRGLFDQWKDVLVSFLYKLQTCILMVAFWLSQFENLAACFASGTLIPGK